MPPNSSSSPTGVLFETDQDVPVDVFTEEIQKVDEARRKRQPTAWKWVIVFAFLHVIAFYGFILMFTSAKIWTSLMVFIMYEGGMLGTTAGAHRLFAHGSYKAKWPLRLFLTFLQTTAYQSSVITWVRDHRVHHKYNETDADPYNARRGFLFCHMGWIFMEKHPAVKVKGKTIDFSDLYSDPILYYQKKYYYYLMIPLCFIIPALIPMYFWHETFINAFCVNIFRYIFCLNVVFSVNSVAHYFGTKPYDKHITPVQNLLVSIFTMGEGWHNYHHAFPWDYKASEYGNYSDNFTCAFIDLMVKIGLAYDLKTASEDMIRKRIDRTGDGSYVVQSKEVKNNSERNTTTIHKKH